MNYNYLRYFSVLAQVEHYTLAAARLGISQPSLSSAIHPKKRNDANTVYNICPANQSVLPLRSIT